MRASEKSYLPAAGRDWALPLYDPLLKLLGADTARSRLLNQADLGRNSRVLDIGCGTGTLDMVIKRLHPDTKVVGLDPDPKALARARRKAQKAAVSIRFDLGFSNELPYADASFDCVFSSFMFHHLGSVQKQKTLQEVCRVLAPGGSFHMLDFVQPETAEPGRWVALLRSNQHLKDNSDSQILMSMSRAGFVSWKRVSQARMLFGLLRIAYYQASM